MLFFTCHVIMKRGEELTESLRNRLDAAVDYYSRNPEVVVVVSGGQGPQEAITEALAMERYLLAQGIPEGQMMKEEAATSTKENFQYSKRFEGVSCGGEAVDFAVIAFCNTQK